MAADNKIRGYLEIKSGEEPTIILLIVYSFFVGIANAFYYTASTSLFLQVFDRGDLPVAYIVGGALVVLCGIAFRKIQTSVSFSRLLKGSILFLIISVGGFFLIYVFIKSAESVIVYILFVWMKVYMFILGMTFWGLAGKLFNLRQGKRLYGLISTGEVISYIFSFFSIPFILKIPDITTKELLYFSFVGLILGFFVIGIMQKKFGDKLSGVAKVKESDTNSKSIADYISPKYIYLLYIMAGMTMFSLIFTDFIFFAQSQKVFEGQGEALSGFLAILFGVISFLEFIIKMFVSGKLLTRYGMQLGLLAMPVLLLIVTVIICISGSVPVFAGLFFPFVALLKLFIRIGRTSFFDPSFQILYQPFPKEIRLFWQSKVEGYPKALGNVIGGLTILAFSMLSFFDLIHYSFVFLIILIFWTRISFLMYNEYRSTLKQLIKQKKFEKQDKKSDTIFSIISSHLRKAKASLLYPLTNLLEHLDPSQFDNIFKRLITDFEKSKKRSKQKFSIILDRILEKNIIDTVPMLDYSVKQKAFPDHEEKIMKLIQELRQASDMPLNLLSETIKSDDIFLREYAVKLIGQSKRYSAYKLIIKALHDHNPTVKKSALIAAGKLKRYELWPAVIENLSSDVYANTAQSALRITGEQILPALDSYFQRIGGQKATLLRIINLVENIGGKKAVNILRSKIDHPDRDVRFRVLNSLRNLRYQATSYEIPYIKQTIETEIGFSIWIMAALLDLGRQKNMDDLHVALKYELKISHKRIFILLGLIYDSNTISHIENNLSEINIESKGYALEIFDMLVSEEEKKLFIPILEKLSYAETIDKYNELFPQQKLSEEDRLIDIVLKDYSRINAWTKSVAIEMLGQYKSPKFEPILVSHLLHPGIAIRETAIKTLYAVNKNLLLKHIKTFEKSGKGHRFNLTETVNKIEVNAFLSIDICRILKSSMYFVKIPNVKLLNLAESSETINLKKDDKLIFSDGINSFFFLVADGIINLTDDSETIKTFSENEIISEMSEIEHINKNMEYAVASDNAQLIRMNIELLYNLMSSDKDILETIISTMKLENLTRKFDMN